MLRILSWNIQQGGGSRHLKILRAIQKEQPHILVFSEFRKNKNGDTISKALIKMGYTHQITPEASPQKNAVLLASKIEFAGSWFPNCDPSYPHSIVRGEFESFEIYGCYLPHKKRHVLVPFLENEIANSEKPSIIVGDLNIGINGVDQKGNSFWYQDELSSLMDSGIKDAFRVKNGDTKEYSWYSHQGNGYRYDHSYVQDVLGAVVKDCYYLHAYREQKYADHSPMVLELG
jgi:exonuclease III